MRLGVKGWTQLFTEKVCTELNSEGRRVELAYFALKITVHEQILGLVHYI